MARQDPFIRSASVDMARRDFYLKVRLLKEMKNVLL